MRAAAAVGCAEARAISRTSLLRALATSYFDYPAGSDTQTTCSTPTATANRANCNNAVGDLTTRGSYTGSASPYGTFDQGGNVFERNEAIISGSSRGFRGGTFGFSPGDLGASIRGDADPAGEDGFIGFRVASIPEPGTGLLLMMGMLGLARRRRRGLAAFWSVRWPLRASRRWCW